MPANEMSSGGDICTGKMLRRLNKAFFPLLYMLGNYPPQPLISLREQLYTEHFLKILTWFDILLRLSLTVVYCF